MPYQVKFAAGFGLTVILRETARDALVVVREAEEDKREGIQVFELGGPRISVEELSALAAKE